MTELTLSGNESGSKWLKMTTRFNSAIIILVMPPSRGLFIKMCNACKRSMLIHTFDDLNQLKRGIVSLRKRAGLTWIIWHTKWSTRAAFIISSIDLTHPV